MLDHEGDDPTADWHVYWAYPADRDPSCRVDPGPGNVARSPTATSAGSTCPSSLDRPPSIRSSRTARRSTIDLRRADNDHDHPVADPLLSPPMLGHGGASDPPRRFRARAAVGAFLVAASLVPGVAALASAGDEGSGDPPTSAPPTTAEPATTVEPATTARRTTTTTAPTATTSPPTTTTTPPPIPSRRALLPPRRPARRCRRTRRRLRAARRRRRRDLRAAPCSVARTLRRHDTGPASSASSRRWPHAVTTSPRPAQGRYDFTTVAAVREVQRRHRILVTGVAGPATLAELGIWSGTPINVQCSVGRVVLPRHGRGAVPVRRAAADPTRLHPPWPRSTLQSRQRPGRPGVPAQPGDPDRQRRRRPVDPGQAAAVVGSAIELRVHCVPPGAGGDTGRAGALSRPAADPARLPVGRAESDLRRVRGGVPAALPVTHRSPRRRTSRQVRADRARNLEAAAAGRVSGRQPRTGGHDR